MVGMLSRRSIPSRTLNESGVLSAKRHCPRLAQIDVHQLTLISPTVERSSDVIAAAVSKDPDLDRSPDTQIVSVEHVAPIFAIDRGDIDAPDQHARPVLERHGQRLISGRQRSWLADARNDRRNQDRSPGVHGFHLPVTLRLTAI